MPVNLFDNVDKRHASSLLIIILATIMSSCAIVRSDDITKIALLAPFEGRYREIGYNALYAVRLAMTEHQAQNIHLLAVDDGGSVKSAIDRVEALNADPDVEAIIALGQVTSYPSVQQANDKPLVIVGFWGYAHADDDTLIVSHPEIAEQVTTIQAITDLDLTSPTVGGDLYMLDQMPDLYENLDNLNIISSGTLPSADFYDRYTNSAQYVPDPNLLATLTYDVAGLVISALQTNTPISTMQYNGINGTLSFADGYWTQAPINRYQYANEQWTLAD